MAAMPRFSGRLLPLTLLLCSALAFSAFVPMHWFGPTKIDWGFFAHRRINRLALLTLPPEMMAFYKPNIDWISDHAVDPDMRRYASAGEAPRHYIDLDNYGVAPFSQLPRNWSDALAQYATVYVVGAKNDTTALFGPLKDGWDYRAFPENTRKSYRRFVARQLIPRWSWGESTIAVDSLLAFCHEERDWIGEVPTPKSVFFTEPLSEHGLLPWNLQRMQRELTEAFRKGDARRIMRLSADMGHYIGDANVPLHTTSNYNGQKTGQHGIHGFWESRIPELFADEDYDYFVGKPEYIEDPNSYFWNLVFDSNSMVDSVLTLERALRLSFPTDRQSCPDMRNGVMVLQPCREYSAAYQTILNNMIERRMRNAIHAVSSVWYTCWVDAGQPDLSKLVPGAADAQEIEEDQALKKAFESGKIMGRPEEH